MYSIDISDVLEFRRSSDNSRKVEKHYVTDTTLKPEDCLPVSDVVITGMCYKFFRSELLSQKSSDSSEFLKSINLKLLSD